jgi:YVTN family beta-propeller protein
LNLSRSQRIVEVPMNRSQGIAIVLLAFFVLLATTLFQQARGDSPLPAPHSPGFLVIANQGDHTALLVDLATRQTLLRVEVGINGHELTVSPDGHFAYVPIYGNSGVGKPGTDGDSIDIVDLQERKLAGHIALGKPVRPHCAKFGPDGLLYVSAELANSVYVIDPAARKVVGEIPTGQIESHMLVITPDGRRAYTANVAAGSISVLDLQKRSLITTIPISRIVQRISISPDGRRVYTHDQNSPRIAIIDTATNAITGWIALPSTVYSSASTPDGRWLVAVSPAGKLFVVDTANGKIAHSFDIPQATGEVLITPDGSRAFISCPRAATVEILDLQTWKLDEPLKFTPGVDGLDFLASTN